MIIGHILHVVLLIIFFHATDGAASCKIGNGSLKLPTLSVSIPVTSPEVDCVNQCSIYRENWQYIAEKMNNELIKKAILLKSSCPLQGSGDPQLSYIDGMKLHNIYLGSSSTESYGQWFMTFKMPNMCKEACRSGQSSVAITSMSLNWGKRGSDDDLFIVCHSGYDKSKNLCTDGHGLSFFQSDKSRLKRTCKATFTKTRTRSSTVGRSWLLWRCVEFLVYQVVNYMPLVIVYENEFI